MKFFFIQRRYIVTLFLFSIITAAIHLYAQTNEATSGNTAENENLSAKESTDSPVLDDNFKDLDMIRLGPTGDTVYDTFVIGDNTQAFTAKRWVTSFYINRYETTYRLWYNVRTRAETELGYKFLDPGQEGSAGRRSKEPTQINRFQPVTMISWYDAIVWCNALSELSGKTPCYTDGKNIIRDSSDTAICDLAVCNWDADGYRLPTETEWEYAARRTPTGYQRGDLVSGQVNATGKSDENVPESKIAWFDADTDCTHIVGTAGTPFDPSAPPAPGSGNANAMGLYDMSGNVLEFCWDWMGDYEPVNNGERSTGPDYGAQRICRGGSWSAYTGFIYAGDRYAYDPNEVYDYMGFRICSSK